MSSSHQDLFSVTGKYVLITGGSRGIGWMIAQGYVAAGAKVIIASRSETACQKAASELGCDYVVSHLSSRQGCEDLARQVAKRFGNRLDILVNNAGTSWGEPMKEDSKSNWGFDKVFDLNVKSIFYLTRACLPMLQQSATPQYPSRIVNIGSVVGLVPSPTPTHAYEASKAAVHQLTKKLAGDLASKSITVNCVAPGFVPSKMSDGLAMWGAGKDHHETSIPLGRMGTADDMAGACLYLTSRAGSWCTGVILTVDGGAHGAMQISNL